MGSITYKYVHLGFAPKVSISCQTSAVPVLTEEELWRIMCCDLIVKLNIGVLLIRDDIDEGIQNFCLAHSVMVFSHVPLKALKMLCHAFQYSPCTYLCDCEEEDVIKNLNVKEWKPSDQMENIHQYFLFNAHLTTSFPLQTIVVCHPSLAILKMAKHQVQHLISRLTLSCQNGDLLPGKGEAEKMCCDFLRKHPQFQNPSDQTTRIMSAIADGYENYGMVVTRKRALSDPSVAKGMDEMSSKICAWRSALSLVLLTLQCDVAIINDAGDLKIEQNRNCYGRVL